MGQRKNIAPVKTTNDYILETSKNIAEDRAIASKLLFDMMEKIETETNTLNHRRLGEVAAKYLEVLQRSNEQLVKVATIVQKQEELNKEDDSLNAEDLFDSISEGK